MWLLAVGPDFSPGDRIHLWDVSEALHPWNQVLLLEDEMREKMRGMSSEEFEGVLHPIFAVLLPPEREFFIDNLLVRIHFIIEMIWWTGLAPWEFEFPFPGSLISTPPPHLRGTTLWWGLLRMPARGNAAAPKGERQRGSSQHWKGRLS